MKKAMRIPSKLKVTKYYVASSMSYAYSKWDRLDDAFTAVGRFVIMDPLEFVSECIGIVEVNEHGKIILKNRLKKC